MVIHRIGTVITTIHSIILTDALIMGIVTGHMIGIIMDITIIAIITHIIHHIITMVILPNRLTFTKEESIEVEPQVRVYTQVLAEVGGHQFQLQDLQLQLHEQVQNRRIVHRVEQLVHQGLVQALEQTLVQVRIHLPVLQEREQLQHHHLHQEAG